MPLYEYQCKKCKHRFEKIQKFSDAPVRKCPECGGAVEKLLSQSAVQFKGSGWYVTDYARKGSSSSAEPAAAGSDGSAAKSDKKEKTDATKSDKKSQKK